MKSIFLDTETTGLRPGQIVQLTYIMEEDKKLIGVKNYFFAVDSVDPEAERVHGFSKEKLDILSEGFTFEELSEEIQEDFEGATLIAHNVKFDRKFIEAEFNKIFQLDGFSKDFCTMAYFSKILKIPAKNGGGYKNPKLEEVVDFYNIDRNQILKIANILFGCDDISFHDARYDTAAMYMCCLKSKGRTKVETVFGDECIDIFE